MRSIRRRKGGRSCFIVGESERPRTKGGRWNVGIATACRKRGGGSRGATVASAHGGVLRCARARGVTRRGWKRGSRDALPHSRGREPRRDRCGRSTAASSRCKRARGVTRRGRAGGSRDALPHSRGRAGAALAMHCPTGAGGSRGATVASAHGGVLRCARARGVTRRGRAGGSREALPHWRGREPRRDRCERCTAASCGASVQGA